MKWSSSLFIERFRKGRLGRKSQHGTFYTKELPDVKILVQKTTYGNRIREVLFNCGFRLTDKDYKYYSRTPTEDDVGSKPDSYLSINRLSSMDFINLEIIEDRFAGSNELLFNSGGKQYLVYKNPSVFRFTHAEFLAGDYHSHGIMLALLNEKQKSIDEAKQDFIPKAETVDFCLGRYWWKEVDESEVPKPSPEVVKQALDTVNPIDFGLPVSVEFSKANVESYPSNQEQGWKAYQYAREKRRAAREVLVGFYRHPSFAPQVTRNQLSQIVNNDRGCYIKGTVTHSNSQIDLGDKWHRMVGGFQRVNQRL
jgi:hypothetical protein